MSKQFRIPRHGGADAGFLGVEFKDTYIVLVSFFIGLIAGRIFGTFGYFGPWLGGWFLNKKYVEWRSTRLEGFFRAWLFGLGLMSYSNAFKSRNVVYVGDENVINPNSHLILLRMRENLSASETPNAADVREQATTEGITHDESVQSK